MSNELAVKSDQGFWDEKQLAALKQIGLGNAPKGDLAIFLHHAQKTGLDPFARQIYMIQRGGQYTIQASRNCCHYNNLLCVHRPPCH